MPKSAKTKLPKHYIASGNDLMSGEVVYLSADGEWIHDIASAQVADDESTFAPLAERASQHRQVAEWEVVAVTMDASGVPVPTTLRELIRERGPTCRPDLGRQAEPHGHSAPSAEPAA